MALRRYILSIIFLLSLFNAKAQFYTGENEPASVKWFKVKTPHFSIIYPEGLDSLSKVYGNLLEKYRIPESWTSGYIPGQKYRMRTPVIMRAFTGISNGLVSWAPKRMELFTLPSSDGEEASPWAKNLVIHESRHLAQMQFGYDHRFRPLTWLFGEIFVGAASALYPGPHLLEGDAVVAETALTNYGRGRSANFLSYYMSAFDNGDYRNWYRWRYGSFKKYSPDHYSLGYMTVAGTRYFYEDPLYMSKYFNRVSRHPLRFLNMQKGVGDVSGERFKKSFRYIMEGFKTMWEEEAAERAPFIEEKQFTGASSFYVSYLNNIMAGEELLTVKSGYVAPRALVKIGPDGSESRLRSFSPSAGNMSYSEALKRLYWSEPVPDMRWGMKMSSKIRYIDIDDKKAAARDLTKKGRLYNPSVSRDGRLVAAIDYPLKGGSALVLLNAEDGSQLARLTAPDSLQFTQAAWMREGLAVSGISNRGNGLYKALLEGDKFTSLAGIIPPEPVSMRNLRPLKDGIMFTSDRTGVDEVYAFSGEEVLQLTSTRYGASDPVFNAAGDTLYFSSLKSGGRHIYKAASSNLLYKRVVFSDIHKYRVADSLSAQEKRLAKEKGFEWPDDKEVEETSFSKPVRYRKVPGIPRFHSWLPFYADYDDFAAMNFNIGYESANTGVTAFFQNLLGTAYGSASYYYNLLSEDKKGRPAAHIKFNYSGLYPVFEISALINDRMARQYARRIDIYSDVKTQSTFLLSSDYPHFNAYLNVYIPLRFSSGGLSRGLTPRVKYSFSNDIYDKSFIFYSHEGSYADNAPGRIVDFRKSGSVFMQVLETSLSAYIMRASAKSLEYPRLGIGGEAGFKTRISLSDVYSSSLYFHLYGYLPGLYKTHGLKLSALYQQLFVDKGVFPENHVLVKPRGFSSFQVSSFLSGVSSSHLKLSADYPMPFSLGDISFLSPVTYITHFVFSPYVDYTMFSIDNKFMAGGLMTIGANFVAKASNFLWMPFDLEFGVAVGWNTGSAYDRLKAADIPLDRFYIGPAVKTSF